MTREQLEIVLRYVEEGGCAAQITYDGKGNYTADFQSRIHAEVCHGEIKAAGFYNVQLLTSGYHMRVN